MPRSILIIRLSAMGDIVMASGVAGALKQRYPGAAIAWLVQPEFSDLLSAHPAVDRVLEWPRARWRRLWRERRYGRLLSEVRRFIRQLRDSEFDLVVDLQGLLKSAVWAWLSGARERIGLRPKEGSRRLMTRVIDAGPRDRHIGSEYRHLVRTLAPGIDYRMTVPVTEADRAFADKFVARERLGAGFAVLCPFTTRPQKHWIEDYWPALARRLFEQLGLRALMLGGPGDREPADRLLAAAGGTVIDGVGRTALRQAAALIARAQLLVGVDTGLTHMGTAFTVPTIALFGSTCPYLVTDSPKSVVLYKNLPCSPCRRNPTCGGDFTCMRLITVDDVATTAQRLLAQP